MTAGRQRTLSPAARRDQMLDAAARLFAQKGFEATTVQDVMGQAGLSKGGFYHHFASKEALLEALAERMAREALAGIDALRNASELDPFARLDAILRHLRAQKAALDPGMLRALEALFDPRNLVLYERVRRAIVAMVLPVLTEVIAEGIADRCFAVSDAESCAVLILHLNAATYDDLAAAIAERDGGGSGAARERLHALVAMQGIAIDRLLGLPDGSITWIEAEQLDRMMGWDRAHA